MHHTTEARLLDYLAAAGAANTVDVLDAYADGTASGERAVGRRLRDMAAEGLVRLVATSDLSQHDVDDLDRVQAALPGECEWFMTIAGV